MKCRVCAEAPELVEVRETYHYRECGMDNVILDIVVRKCPTCSSLMPIIPGIEGLHDALANAIVKKDGRLATQEIVFLRKSLGWSGVDFAQNMGLYLHLYRQPHHRCPSMMPGWLKIFTIPSKYLWNGRDIYGLAPIAQV